MAFQMRINIDVCSDLSQDSGAAKFRKSRWQKRSLERPTHSLRNSFFEDR
jgi:hypothetical protein